MGGVVEFLDELDEARLAAIADDIAEPAEELAELIGAELDATDELLLEVVDEVDELLLDALGLASAAGFP